VEKKALIIAGKNKFDAERLRPCLVRQEITLVPCETAEQVLDLLDILPLCGAPVSLVLFEPGILNAMSDDLAARLSKCSTQVPFTLLTDDTLETDLAEKFERICANRVKFKREGNPLIEIIERTRASIMQL